MKSREGLEVGSVGVKLKIRINESDEGKKLGIKSMESHKMWIILSYGGDYGFCWGEGFGFIVLVLLGFWWKIRDSRR